MNLQPGVRSGKPCFVGTRIAVYDVLEYLASGMTHAEIMDNFPELSEAHIRAALSSRPCGSVGSLPLREAAVRPELVRLLVGDPSPLPRIESVHFALPV